MRTSQAIAYCILLTAADCQLQCSDKGLKFCGTAGCSPRGMYCCYVTAVAVELETSEASFGYFRPFVASLIEIGTCEMASNISSKQDSTQKWDIQFLLLAHERKFMS